MPPLQVLAGQRGVQCSAQLQHTLVQGEARGVQAVHCRAGGCRGWREGVRAACRAGWRERFQHLGTHDNKSGTTSLACGISQHQQIDLSSLSPVLAPALPASSFAGLLCTGHPARRGASCHHHVPAHGPLGAAATHPPEPAVSLRMPRKTKAEGTARPMKEKSSPAMEASASTTAAGLGTSLRGGRQERDGVGWGGCTPVHKTRAGSGTSSVVHTPGYLSSCQLSLPCQRQARPPPWPPRARTCWPPPWQTCTCRGRSASAGSRAACPASSPPARSQGRTEAGRAADCARLGARCRPHGGAPASKQPRHRAPLCHACRAHVAHLRLPHLSGAAVRCGRAPKRLLHPPPQPRHALVAVGAHGAAQLDCGALGKGGQQSGCVV